MSDLTTLQDKIKNSGSPVKAKASMWFFKTGEGQYGYGDKFLGLTVPEQHTLAREFKDLALEDTLKLLSSEWHEERLIALFLLDAKFKKGDDKLRKKIYEVYLKNIKQNVNNWDLVDSSASQIVGTYLIDKPRDILYKLAKSDNLWERRVAIVSTFAFIRDKDYKDALQIAEILLGDKHDLIHKAVGWVLREIGKQCGEDVLEGFLKKYYKTMPRTALRYSLEKFTPEKRAFYMRK